MQFRQYNAVQVVQLWMYNAVQVKLILYNTGYVVYIKLNKEVQVVQFCLQRSASSIIQTVHIV